MGKGLVVAFCCLILTCSDARALTFSPPHPELDALAQTSYAPLPSVQVAFSNNLSACSGPAMFFACENDDMSSIMMPFVTAENYSYWKVAFFHELGHVYDHVVLTDQERNYFTDMINEHGTPWVGLPGAASPKEVFAQAYSICARHRAIHGPVTYIVYGYNPSPSLHRKVCRMIRYSALGQLPS